AKAAILRSRWKFHGNRYHEAARFVTETSGVSRKFRSMELLPVHAIHPLFTSSSISRRADSLAGDSESHSPPRRRSSWPQDRGAAASRQRRYGAGRDRRGRQGLSLALEDRGDRLDLVAGISRQPRADRAAAVERALAREHLRRHQISQHRHFHE